MAVTKLSIANGLFTANTSWSDCNGPAENDSEATTAGLPTSGAASSDSASFTPGIVTVDAIAIKVAQATAVGTITVVLRNVVLGADVAGTSVTVNLADLPQQTGSVTTTGWTVFKFASPVTLLGATTYLVRITKSGGSGTINLYVSSGNDWARELRISGAAASAPAVNDKLIVSGELTGAGTGNTWTITYDNTASTVWGASASGQSISVGPRGILEQQVTASKAYILNYLGRFQIAGGGIWRNNGGTAMPSTSSLTVTAQNVANVDCGIEIGAMGTVTLTGASLTFVSTKLAADAAASATSLTTADSTGWANGDTIALASTTRTASECESKALTAGASGTALTIAALTNAHSGTNNANGDIRGELANLTRNIKIQGLSSTLGSYVNVNATAAVTLRYVEFTKIGSATSLKRGIDIATTTGTFDCQFGSIHDCTVASSRGFNVTSASGSGITISSNVTYNIANFHFSNAASTGVQIVSGNLCIRTTDSAVVFNVTDVGSTFTNNTAVGAQTTGWDLNEGNLLGTFSGNVAHACVTDGFSIDAPKGTSTASSCVAWRNGRHGIFFSLTPGGFYTFDSWTIFGNATSGVSNNTFSANGTLAGIFVFSNGTIQGGTTLTQPVGFLVQSGWNNIQLVSMTLGSPNTHATADIQLNVAESLVVTAANTTFNSATIVGSQSNLYYGSYVASMRHNTTAGSHRFYSGEGTGTTDTAIFESPATSSLRVTPIASAGPTLRPAESAPPGFGFQVPVKNGNAVTLTVRVRKSVVGDAGGAAWNGNQPRLWVRRNVAAGITSDTLLATAAAANGSWETLTGVTSAVTDDSTLEFFVDSGVGVASPAGWFNVGIWQVTRSGYWGSLGLEQVWFNGFPLTGFSSPVIVRMR